MQRTNTIKPQELLKNQAYAEIRRMILKGNFNPGEVLAERQLAARLGMSTTPIRAALQRLESDGLLSIIPKQGAMIHAFTPKEISDHYEIRAVLESYVLRQLAGRLTADQIALIQANLDEQIESINNSDTRRSVELDNSFHMFFIRFLGNDEILKVVEDQREKSRQNITRAYSISVERSRMAYHEHVAIAQKVIQGEPDEAARLLIEHLEFGKNLLLDNVH